MKKFTYLMILLFILPVQGITQEKIITESSTHIFWQENRKLTVLDYQSEPPTDSKVYFYCDSLGMCIGSAFGLFHTIDIPKKKRVRGILLEKVWLAPMFDKTTSFILDNTDPLGIEKEQIIFDIIELSTRTIRKQLNELKEKMDNNYGATSVLLEQVLQNAENERRESIDLFVRDVYILKKENSYEKWRSLVDQQLEELKEYTTTPEDCYRAIIQQPLDNRYKKAFVSKQK